MPAALVAALQPALHRDIVSITEPALAATGLLLERTLHFPSSHAMIRSHANSRALLHYSSLISTVSFLARAVLFLCSTLLPHCRLLHLQPSLAPVAKKSKIATSTTVPWNTVSNSRQAVRQILKHGKGKSVLPLVESILGGCLIFTT